MADVAQNTQHDFWRPPLRTPVPEVVHADLVEACDRCGSEFIVGARYCHSCGAERPEPTRAHESAGIFPLNHLASILGLRTAALVAFLVGVLCLLGAIAVGFIFNAKTIVDWQAVQVWRIEWLLGSVAAFVAGCLLKSNR